MKSLVMGLLAILIISMNIFGADYRGNERILISANDSLSTDLFSGSRYMDILGVVNGDVFSGCQRMNVEGEITEDFFAGAQEINIRGKIRDNAICAAQTITIDGEIGGDLIVFGAEVRITQRTHIKGNVFVGSGAFILDGGKIDGWVRGGGGDLYLNGSVGDTVNLKAGHVRFGPTYGAPMGTRLTLKKDLDLNTLENRPVNLTVIVKKNKAFYQKGYFYWTIITMFIVGLLISLIFKNFTYNILNASEKNILKNTGIGFLSLIVIPLTILILAILVLTIPAALILLAIFLILLYLSSIFTGLYIGKYVLELLGNKEERLNLVLPLIVGLLAIVLLSKLPFIGWLIKLLAVSFGMGSFLMYLFGLKKVKPETP